MIAHYRFRPPRLTTTVRLTADGPLKNRRTRARSETLRALYILEAGDLDAIVDSQPDWLPSSTA